MYKISLCFVFILMVGYPGKSQVLGLAYGKYEVGLFQKKSAITIPLN